jgi:hypothetical protein
LQEIAHDAALVVAKVTDRARVLGAFQRASDVSATDPIVRRASGGPAVILLPGAVYLGLALRTPSALVACDASRILNRYVRPLLRGLTRAGVTAHYFGRDWVSASHRPIAQVAFAHDAGTGRTVFEAFIGVNAAVWDETRASHLEKAPVSAIEIAKDADAANVAAMIRDAYATDFRHATEAIDVSVQDASIEPRDSDPPWNARAAEAIGAICAGRDSRGKIRVGGEILVSRDAIVTLEERLASLDAMPSLESISRAVDETLGAPGVALFGVKSLLSFRDAIAAALDKEPA